MVGDTITMSGRSTMDANEMAYARQVYLYNDRVVQGGVKPSLVNMFADIANNMDDKVYYFCEAAWILIYIKY